MFVKFFRNCVITSCLFISWYGYANQLTNQQINLLLEHDDIQIFTKQSLVKKATVTIEQSSDQSQGKTIIEYDKKGLLINYYAASVITGVPQDQSTMITTLMSTEMGKWQRKQTLGSYEIDNSLYQLEGSQFTITMQPTNSFDGELLLTQKLDNSEALSVTFSYATPPEKESLNINYKFNPLGYLVIFDFSNINTNEYGYNSIIRAKFEYDEQQRLVASSEDSSYQFMNEPEDRVITEATYSDFDQYGNWLTKIEQSSDTVITFKRIIEYWSE